jgi:O-succinylhomoserine sulfhydrylase
LSPEDKASAGITDNLVRISVGIESLEDIKTDLKRGLAALAE